MVRPSADRILLVSGKRRRSGTLSIATRNGASGLHLVEARDPARALGRLSKERFDAVALELAPLKALELASLVRKDHPGVLVILLVPKGDPQFKQTALAAGAHAVIASPRDSAARLSLLEAALQTLRLVAINRKLTEEVWTTARSLVQAVRRSEQSWEKRRNARDSSDPFLPS